MSGAGYAGTTPLGSELVKDALQRASSELDMLFTTLVRRAAVVSTANIQAKTHRRGSTPGTALRLKSTVTNDLSVDMLQMLLPFCDSELAEHLKTFIRVTKLRNRRLHKVLFRKLLFEAFYMAELSAAGGDALARGHELLDSPTVTGATPLPPPKLNPNHQCPMSLAIISYLRSSSLCRQVQQITEAQSQHGALSSSKTVTFTHSKHSSVGHRDTIAPLSPSRGKSRARKAKHVLLSWTKSQMFWKKLQFAVRGGAFAVSLKRRLAAGLCDVFAWSQGGLQALSAQNTAQHVHWQQAGMKDLNTVSEIQLYSCLLTLRCGNGTVFGWGIDQPPPTTSSSQQSFADVLVSSRGRSLNSQKPFLLCNPAVGKPWKSLAVGQDTMLLIPQQVKPLQAPVGVTSDALTAPSCVYRWHCPNSDSGDIPVESSSAVSSSMSSTPTVTVTDTEFASLLRCETVDADKVLLGFPQEDYLDVESYYKASTRFRADIDALNAEMLSSRSKDKFRSMVRVLSENKRLAQQLQQGVREALCRFQFSAGPRRMDVSTCTSTGEGISSAACIGNDFVLVTSYGTLLRYESGTHRVTPIPLLHLEPDIKQQITRLSCGRGHAAALTVQGHVVTWGDGSSGQLGHGSYNNELRPRVVESLRKTRLAASKVACGNSHTLMCDITGGMWVWGSNVNGQLGVGRLQDGNSIVPVTVFIDGSAPREADDVMAGFNRHAAEEREWKRWAKRFDKEATVRDALDRMVADTVMRGGLPEPEMQSLNTLTTLAPATEAMSDTFKPLLTNILDDGYGKARARHTTVFTGYTTRNADTMKRVQSAYLSYCDSRSLLPPEHLSKLHAEVQQKQEIADVSAIGVVLDEAMNSKENVTGTGIKPGTSPSRASTVLLRVCEPHIMTQLRRSKIVSVTSEGDACGALSAGGTVFVWGKALIQSTESVSPPLSSASVTTTPTTTVKTMIRWSPETLPLLQHALIHKATSGCPTAQRQLNEVYGKSVALETGTPVSIGCGCCRESEVEHMARLTSPSSQRSRTLSLGQATSNLCYTLSQLRVSEYGVAIGCVLAVPDAK